MFAFGMFTLMIFVDVIKLVSGRLRPIFLEVCDVNTTLCGVNGNWGGDELCTNGDELEIRHARLVLYQYYTNSRSLYRHVACNVLVSCKANRGKTQVGRG